MATRIVAPSGQTSATAPVEGVTNSLQEFKLPNDLIIDIAPYGLPFVEYCGQRHQLEAEKLIPEGIAWPGAGDKRGTRWQSPDWEHWLRRERPPGFRGGSQLSRSQDWWCLRVELKNAPSAEERVRLKHERELRRFLPEEALRRQETWRATARARGDMRFQRMLSGILPARKKPGRKPAAGEVGRG